jgi:hypothetical protein
MVSFSPLYKEDKMPELVIKYKNKRTLDVLLDISRYFGFSVILPKQTKPEKEFQLNGVTILAADKSIDASELETVFTGKSIDAKQLRTDAWQRTR